MSSVSIFCNYRVWTLSKIVVIGDGDETRNKDRNIVTLELRTTFFLSAAGAIWKRHALALGNKLLDASIDILHIYDLLMLVIILFSTRNKSLKFGFYL